MSTKTALIVVVVAAVLFGMYLWKFGLPEPAPEAPEEGETVLREPDSPTPAAGVCAFHIPRDTVTFQILEGIPNPRCARVLQWQRIAFANSTEATVTFEFAEVSFEIDPGVTALLDESVGLYLAPGVHVVAMDIYGGSGPEVWVQDESVVWVEGEVTQQFVSARAIVVRIAEDIEISLGIDAETRITRADGTSVAPEEFSLALPPGTRVSVIADMENETTGLPAQAGLALEIQIQ